MENLAYTAKLFVPSGHICPNTRRDYVGTHVCIVISCDCFIINILYGGYMI